MIIMSDLYNAAAAGDLERVQVLVEQGADKDESNVWGERSLLWTAAREGHLKVIRYLVEQGADMEKADHNGWTPLMVASCNGHLEVVRYLLEQGANSDKASDGGWTSLHLAAHSGHMEVAKLLMAYGAGLNARNIWGKLPIEMGYRITEEIKQAIRDEPERRRDQQPRKRCIEQDRHTNAAASASALQEEDEAEELGQKQPAGGELGEGEVADEDQDSEPSNNEDDN